MSQSNVDLTNPDPKAFVGDTVEDKAPLSRKILETSFCPSELRKHSLEWSMERFQIKKVLAEGAISTVVHASCRYSGVSVTLKIYHRDRLNTLNVRQISREIDIHASLCHKNIIKLYAAFEDIDAIYLVLEYAAGGLCSGKNGHIRPWRVVEF